MALHSSLTDSAIAKITEKPTAAPTLDKQLVAQISTDRTTLWFADGTAAIASWKAVGGTPIIGSTNPAGSVQPDYVGQFYYNTATNLLYIAESLNMADWVSFTGTGGGGGS